MFYLLHHIFVKSDIAETLALLDRRPPSSQKAGESIVLPTGQPPIKQPTIVSYVNFVLYRFYNDHCPTYICTYFLVLV